MPTLYDSVTAADIPADAQLVAGYINGRFAWSASDWDRFPNAIKLRISIDPTVPADVLDVELGDAAPSDCPGFIQRAQAAGIAKPIIYCGASVTSAVAYYCGSLEHRLWTADYTGVPHITPGADLTQYADPTYGSGGHYDVSEVSDAWLTEWQADHVPAPVVDPALAYVPQEYQDKFGAKTPYDVYANLEGIISNLLGKLNQVKTIVSN
jgi:hypothetical protein